MESPLSMLLVEKGSDLYSVSPMDSVADAVRLLVSEHIGCALVMDNDLLAGVFSERDLLTRVVGPGLDVEATRVQDVMTADVLTVPPKLTVREALMICTERRIRHLPVERDGVLLGMVSLGDLARWAIRQQQEAITDLMRYIHGEQA